MSSAHHPVGADNHFQDNNEPCATDRLRKQQNTALPKEALEALARSYDKVLAKYAKPVLNAAQDGPHNQIESKSQPSKRKWWS
jgi:hypothetical protein